MKTAALGGAIFFSILSIANPGWSQSANLEGHRGSLPDGVADSEVEIPRAFPHTINTPAVEHDVQRALPMHDPAALREGFGTVTRKADGSTVEEDVLPSVLDAIRSKRSAFSPDAPEAEVDPLFSDDETGRYIIGTDDRIRVQNSTNYPFRTFGLLEAYGLCSATLVGPRSMITAAHCVYSHTNGWAKQMTFYPGANGSGNFPYRGYEYSTASIPQGYISNFKDSYASVMPWDMAIITLKDAAGDRLGWIGMQANDGWDFLAYNVGYPGDKPRYTMWRTKCDFYASAVRRESEVEHNCDIWSGSSGSALYRYTDSNDKRHVEAIVIAGSRNPSTGETINIASLITSPFFHWLKGAWK